MNIKSRIILGRAHTHFNQCRRENFIGVDYALGMDLSPYLSGSRDYFETNLKLILKEKNPDGSKVSHGLICSFLRTIVKDLEIGDFFITPDGSGKYHLGQITGPYFFQPDGILPHRRSVKWFDQSIHRSDMSSTLSNSIGTPGTCCDVSSYNSELYQMFNNKNESLISGSELTSQNSNSFELEKHLEDFICSNWKNIEEFNNYDIYQENGEIIGRQYPVDTGFIDILAKSKDNKELLVVELKRDKCSDVALGQIQRYMGYVLEELIEEGQTVKGIIVGKEKDLKLKRALAVTNNIFFFNYDISFRLNRG